jgi:hypothetical protein
MMLLWSRARTVNVVAGSLRVLLSMIHSRYGCNLEIMWSLGTAPTIVSTRVPFFIMISVGILF